MKMVGERAPKKFIFDLHNGNNGDTQGASFVYWRQDLMRYASVKERFWDNAQCEPNSGCWLWIGTLNSGGYGQLTVRGRSWTAQRVSYTAYKGPIPDGLHIDHLCRVRQCVNPDHLEAVTRKENARRGIRDGDNTGNQNTRKTHCVHGHEFTASNTISRNGGAWRGCRECKRIFARRYRLKERAKTAERRRLREPRMHCSAGHEYTEENTYYYAPRKSLICRECNRANQARFLERKAA